MPPLDEGEKVSKADAATRCVFAERTGEGYYLDIDWNREELGCQGISIEAAQVAVQNAIGGETVTEVIDGRARYGVRAPSHAIWGAPSRRRLQRRCNSRGLSERRKTLKPYSFPRIFGK